MSSRHRSEYASAFALPIISLFSLALFFALGRCTPGPAGNEPVDGAGIGVFDGTPTPGDDTVGSDAGTGLTGVSDDDSSTIDHEAPEWSDITPDADAILVSIVMHCEEPPAYPNFVSDKTTFQQHRAALIEFATMLSSYDVKFDYQSDWNFLKAIIAHDDRSNTNGKNLLRYLAEDLGFQIDPHAHETSYSYADVAYLIELNGVTPTGIVGGYIAAPPQDSNLERFWTTVSGDVYVGKTWNATALWGGGTGNHVNDDALHASGVWKPRDAAHPTEHDGAAPLPNIGNFGGTWDRLDLLLQLRDQGKLAPGIHTCTIMTNQRDVIDAAWRTAFEAELLERRTHTGVRWVTLNEVLEIWQDQFSGNANILTVAEAEAL